MPSPRPSDRLSALHRRDDARRVTQVEVLREWLKTERTHPDEEWFPVESLDEREALDELLERKPGAAAFVWRDAPVEWYALTLDREAFARLRVVEGPEDLRWRELSPDGTVVGAARRVSRADSNALADETGVDVDLIHQFREDPLDRPLVLSTRQGCVPTFVADGNHRAVALALRMQSGDFTPPRAYLGVGANPVVRPFLERLCGAIRRVRERITASTGDR